MNNPEIKTFIRENTHLFWWIKPEEREHIELNFLVESVLNYGDASSFGSQPISGEVLRWAAFLTIWIWR